MIEADAKAWLADRFGMDATDRVALFLDAVIQENSRQNLISPATLATIWVRHAVDSAQLLGLAPETWRTWLDVGTGGGFPGMVVALLAPDRSVVMVEPRKRRAAFLHDAVSQAGLRHASVSACKVEGLTVVADVISARAVAAPADLLRSASHCATVTTTWLLPRGRSGLDLSVNARVFHVEHSVTDSDSTILVGRGVPQ